MPAIVTNKFRIHNAKQFVEAFDEVSTTSGAAITDSSGLLNTNMYLFIGKVTAWTDDTAPPTPRCDVCSKTFKCIDNLNNHIANSKGHKKKAQAAVKPFELVCALCDKTFAGKRVQKRFDQHCRTKSHLLKILQNVDKTTECG